MTDTPANRPIDDSLSALEQVSSWLSSLGIKIEKNRLSTYRRAFRTINAYISARTIQKIRSELSPIEAANAFHEFGEIFQVWRGLKSLDDPILRQKLAKAVKGPVMLSEERPETSEPRNTLFELVIAAHLSLCGIKVWFRDPDDIVARVLHTPLLIECKRIQKGARFKDRFDEAEDQLVRNLANEASPGSKGVIAIWSAPQQIEKLTASPTVGAHPNVAIDSQGNAAMAWIEPGSAGESVIVARYQSTLIP